MRNLSFIMFYLFLGMIISAQSPHGSNFKMDCTDCHTVNSWKVNQENISFKHSTTGFDLTGQHKSLQCQSCHSSLVFAEKKGKTDCADCHTDIHENSVGKNCVRCHSTRTWIIEKITDLHRTTRFPLIGGHETADCAQCHVSASKLKFEPLGIRCFDCHKSNYYSTTAPNHVKANYSTDCQQCHSLSSQTWSTMSVDHSFFPLTGAHNIPNCFACHSKGGYAGLSTSCFSCHQDKYNSASSPNHISLNFSKDCSMCHSVSAGAWKPASFPNHDQFYMLTGAHSAIKDNCIQCHTAGYFQNPRQCVDCHQKDYDNSVNPNHKSAGFSTDCAGCHSTAAWKPSTFDHDNTYFPIYSGAHNGKWNNCSDCHTTQSNYALFECINCHEHSKTSMDSKHTGVNGYSYISSACYACHPRGSKDGIIDHSLTAFPLIGAHLNVSCGQCHTTTYAGTSTACYSCHQSKYLSAPNHTAQNYPQDCKQCHTPVDWKQINFNHTNTAFPLLGAHLTVNCSNCHTSSLAGTSKLCYSCHQSNYTAAPDHASNGYPQNCEQCHNTSDWKTVTFNHSNTAFPLIGAHLTAKCNSCHTSVFAGTPKLCSSCHIDKYQTAANHTALNYPQNCEQCHNPIDWKQINFNHSTTGFVLTGNHITITCNSCHVTKLAGTPTLCYACHQSNYTSAPDHVSLGYPQNCEQCHNTTDWKSVTFNHSNTAFPLTGAHLTATCSNCHTSVFKGTSTVCSDCHTVNYNGTTNPNHASIGIPNICGQCHSTNPGWKPASFPIHNNYFVLQGAHISLQCSNCHNGNYSTKISNLCSSCHINDYNSVTNPNHLSAKFPLTCEICHTQTAWKPSTFNHDGQYFPIYSGSHNGKWNLCTDCHTNQSNYSVFECINCHEHSQTSMDSKHSGVRNYVYLSSACYSCHPTGRGG